MVIRHVLTLALVSLASVPAISGIREDFRSPKGPARENVGPLFWLHGDPIETPGRILEYVRRVHESGQGFLVIESRPHKEWLKVGWWRDCDLILSECRRLGLKVMIYDDWWWPSQGMGGEFQIPLEFQCRDIGAVVYDRRKAPRRVMNEIVRVTAKETSRGVFTLCPDGDKTIVYNWCVFDMARVGDWFKCPLVNGLDEAAVDWFIDSFLKPYHERYAADFDSGLITGFFFDEPQTHGWWGPALEKELKVRGENIGELLTSFKFRLADPAAQASARYRFFDARAEAWGRTMYGRQSDWCRKHGVFSSGHFREDNWGYYSTGRCASNVMQLMKYVTVPGVDIVSRDYYPEQRTDPKKQEAFGQVPKYASSAAHVYNLHGGLCWSEMFGAYRQNLTYPQMKWLLYGHLSRGVYRMIPHSFNTRAPYDNDCAPYFFNGGFEPRYPLFRVWADCANRSALLLSSAEHICRIAQCVPGISYHVGKTVRPEMFTFAIQEAQLDCDWMDYDSIVAAIIEKKPRTGRPSFRTASGKEHYDILTLPATECVPFAVLEKALAFAKSGGVVVGYGIRPCNTPTRGKTVEDARRIVDAIFAQPTALFIDGEPDGAKLRAALARNYPGECRPLAVREIDFPDLTAEDARMLEVAEYEKDGNAVFFITNQDCNRRRDLSVRSRWPAADAELWDPMQGTIERPPVENGLVNISLEPSQSVFLVWPKTQSEQLPCRIDYPDGPVAFAVNATVAVTVKPVSFDAKNSTKITRSPYGESVETEMRFDLSALKTGERVYFICAGSEYEDSAAIEVNGAFAGGFIGAPYRLDITRFTKPGSNVLETKPFRIKNPRIVIVTPRCKKLTVTKER